MKKIKKIIVLVIGVFMIFTLVGCLGNSLNDKKEEYKPNLPNYEFIPNKKTTLTISEATSGSALLKVEELENVSYYVFEVSLFDDFPVEFTKLLTSTTSEYRLFFDDNSKFYVKAYGVTNSGLSYEPSNSEIILSKYANHVVLDDFSNTNLSGWQPSNAKIQSDYHSLIVNPINLVDEIELTKKYQVNYDLANLFEIKFITKNIDSAIDVSLLIDGAEHKVIQTMETISKGYIRFDLASLNLSGTKETTVIIKSSGKNKGFQLDYLRFIYESAHQDLIGFIKQTLTNQYNEITYKSAGIKIKNDPEPTVVRKPMIEVNFNPQELPLLEIELTGYRPSDTFGLTIKNGNDVLLYELEPVYIQNYKGRFSIDLASYQIIETDVYTITYNVSHERVVINSMQLVGASDITIDVTKANNWTDGYSATINDQDRIVLKPTIYNYGDVRKEMTIDLTETPIIFFDVEAVSGMWAAKVIPYGATSDITIISDTKILGVSAFNLASILDAEGPTTFTIEIFVIGGSAGDKNAYLQMNPIKFGNALSIFSEIPDGVESTISYDVEELNLDDLGYIYLDVELIAQNASWKLYLIDKETNRRYEMKTSLEKKYTQRYNRSKSGKYIYDIKDITGLNGIQDFEVVFVLYGNNAEAILKNIVFTQNNNIPTSVHSAY